MDEPSQQHQAELQACIDVAQLYVQAAIASLERIAEMYRESAEDERQPTMSKGVEMNVEKLPMWV